MVSEVIRIAVVTSLYPNSKQPRHGIFVEQRLRHLVDTGQVEARVIAPVPWFWSAHPRFGRYAIAAQVPQVEYRHGIEIRHPRYLVIPKIGMTLGPASMVQSVRPVLADLRAEGFDFDLIDAHYFYPDGVAAVRLARAFDRPCVVTARGSDINSIARMRVPGRQIRAAANAASGLVTVSESLANGLRPLVADRNRIDVLRNGVDPLRFAPASRRPIRDSLGLSGAVWLCAGHLVERKGFHLAVQALVDVPEATLLIAGDGGQRTALESRAATLGVAGRIRFIGAIEPDALARYYNAADALILPTRSEGMPNVVLEALACGTAVIATAVDGIPEIMNGPPAGRLMGERSVAGIVNAWNAMSTDELGPSGRRARREYARAFDWSSTTDGQLDLFRRVLDRTAGQAPAQIAGQAGG